MRLILFFLIVFVISCKGPMDPKLMENDAEQIAFDKCNMQVVTKRLEKLNKRLEIFQDSLKLTNLDERNRIRLDFLKRQTSNKIEYYTEQKNAYLHTEKEEIKEYRTKKYANEEDWQKLNELAEQKLKAKQPCESTAD